MKAHMDRSGFGYRGTTWPAGRRRVRDKSLSRADPLARALPDAIGDGVDMRPDLRFAGKATGLESLKDRHIRNFN